MCLFYVNSNRNSFKSFLKNSKLPNCQSHERGEVIKPGKKGRWSSYGFQCEVSHRHWNDTNGQILDTIKFMEKYGNELRVLLDNYQINNWYFDIPFPIHSDQVQAKPYLPSRLLTLAGKFHIQLDFILHQ